MGVLVFCEDLLKYKYPKKKKKKNGGEVFLILYCSLPYGLFFKHVSTEVLRTAITLKMTHADALKINAVVINQSDFQ